MEPESVPVNPTLKLNQLPSVIPNEPVQSGDVHRPRRQYVLVFQLKNRVNNPANATANVDGSGRQSK
jgi:hypothetical protein